jgi:hypothetical protein
MVGDTGKNGPGALRIFTDQGGASAWQQSPVAIAGLTGTSSLHQNSKIFATHGGFAWGENL